MFGPGGVTLDNLEQKIAAGDTGVIRVKHVLVALLKKLGGRAELEYSMIKDISEDQTTIFVATFYIPNKPGVFVLELNEG